MFVSVIVRQHVEQPAGERAFCFGASGVPSPGLGVRRPVSPVARARAGSIPACDPPDSHVSPVRPSP